MGTSLRITRRREGTGDSLPEKKRAKTLTYRVEPFPADMVLNSDGELVAEEVFSGDQCNEEVKDIDSIGSYMIS